MNNKKTVVIVLVVIVAVIIIYFFGSKAVGKAITLPVDLFAAGTGGIELPLRLPVEAGGPVTVRIGAHLPSGKESVGFSFTLSYDNTILEFVDVDTKLPEWGTNPATDFIRTTTTENTVTFEHATIDFRAGTTINGPVRLAEVNFLVKSGQEVNLDNIGRVLTIDSLQVLDLSAPHGNLLTDAIVQPSGRSLCTQPAVDDVLCGAFCLANTATYCPDVDPTLGYTTDINGDRSIDGQDAFIILKIDEAGVRSECGASTQVPCSFGNTLTCDDGSFRVNGYHAYTFVAGDVCPYANTAEYVGGGST